MAAAGTGWNIYVNADWNKGWADGNFFLVNGTLYEVIQLLISIGLISEEPTWMWRMKALRVFSVAAAAVQVFQYTWSLIDAAWLIWSDETQEITDGFSLMRVFVVCFDIMMHWPGYWISLAIGIKEISMEFFQFWNESRGNRTTDFSIGMKDWAPAFAGGLTQFMPITYEDYDNYDYSAYYY